MKIREYVTTNEDEPQRYETQRREENTRRTETIREEAKSLDALEASSPLLLVFHAFVLMTVMPSEFAGLSLLPVENRRENKEKIRQEERRE